MKQPLREKLKQIGGKHLLNEYKGLDKSVSKQLMQIHASLMNTLNDISVDRTNVGHGDKPQLSNHQTAQKMVEDMLKIHKKLQKTLKVK
jgi:hypothetical protein